MKGPDYAETVAGGLCACRGDGGTWGKGEALGAVFAEVAGIGGEGKALGLL